MELPFMRRMLCALFILLTLTATPALAAIGRTPGFASVTADGEASYTIPIALPPGTNGMTPALALEYRHRTENGLLGVGWSVNGLSQIARCPRTLVQDGILSRVTQTAADRFCLDGQRLVVINGVAYGAAGAEYRTEIESFSRIRSYAGAGVGPQYFVVESADGRIFEYGATPDSRIDSSAAAAHPSVPALVWTLNRIRDRSGNVIDFSYQEGPGVAYRIASIRYNSNPSAGVAPSHEVAFLYETRPDNEVDTSYLAGMPVREVLRLDRIEIRFDGTVLQTVDLGYESALTDSKRSRLASIQQCATSGADCLSPTILGWQNSTPGFQPPVALTAAMPANAWVDDWWRLMDLNGDGRQDFVWAGGSTNPSVTIRYRMAQSGGGFGPEIDTGIPCLNGVGVPFDHNGDARDDLLMISASREWTVIPGRETGLGSPIATGVAVPPQVQDYRGADLNGDGLGDIVWSEIYGYSGNSLVVRARLAAAGGGVSPATLTLYDQSQAIGYEFPEGGQFLGPAGRRIDLDGDGAEELLMNENFTIARIGLSAHETEYFDSAFPGAAVLDFNGDGCSDFAYRHYTGSMRIRIGGCGLPWSGPELLGPLMTPYSGVIQAFDWNNDGREDLLLRGAVNWHVAISEGDRVRPVADTGVPVDGGGAPRTVDIDGDGLRDLAWRAGGQFRHRRRNGPQPDLLRAVTDGFGVRSAFTYSPLTDSSAYARGTGANYPVQDRQSGVTVVSRLESTDGSGNGANQATEYSYEGLRHHVLGRGSLGFARRTSTDTTPGERHRLEENFRQDFPYTGLPAGVVFRQESGPRIATTDFNWTALDFGSGQSLRRFPRIVSQTHRDFHVGGALDGTVKSTVVRTVAAVDSASGLPIDEATTVTEVSGGNHAGSSATFRSLRSNVLNDTANWCLGRPQSLQTIASHSLTGGAAITRSASQVWDGVKCRPTQQRIEPGNAQLQTTYGLAYDAFGNLASRNVTGIGMSARTTSVNWGERGQLPTAITNALAQVTTIGWNRATGWPTEMTDPNGLKVGWAYDAFGNPLLETASDGTRTTWSRSACSSGCDSRTRYRLRQEDRDTAGIVRAMSHADFDQHDRAFRTATQQPGGGVSISRVDADARGRTIRTYLPHWEGAEPAGYWQLGYDAVGRLTQAALHSAGGVANRSLQLGHEGLTVVRTDALGRSTSETRTAWGSLVQVVDAAGNSTRYDYDARGKLLQVRDALNQVVESIAYDLHGQKLSHASQDMGNWSWTRNALGETTSMRDAKQQTITFSYDALGRPTSRNAPDGVTTLTWGNNAASRNIGQLAGRASPGYAESLTYDAAGRPSARTIVTDATYRYDYSYDALGLLETMSYPVTANGQRLAIRHVYDAGKLVRIFDSAAPQDSLWRLNASDASGNTLDETLGSGIRVITGFDPVSNAIEYRQATAGANQIQSLSYAWDVSDNLLRRQDALRGLTEDFSYDGLGRLDQSRRNGVLTLDLDYDATGNIRWKSDVCPSSAPCYTYDALRRHAVTSAGGQTYAYDANGNMTSRSGAAVLWTSDNLPRSIAHANGNRSQFWYGASGNRWKQLATVAGTNETTIYAGELTEKVTRGGTTTWRQYVSSPDGVVAVRLQSGASAPTLRYVTKDHLGSTDRIVDASGSSLVAESFTPFGKRRGANWAGSATAAELAVIANVTRDGFTGHEHLDNLDLIHMNGRVYDPRIGRFLSADPYVTAPYDGQGPNRYSYVWNNPLAFTDPSGFGPETPCMVADQGVCARVTVIGLRWQPVFYGFGAGHAQVESASQRDPCGQEGNALTCAQQGGRFVSPSQIVLTAGTKPDPTLTRSPQIDYLAGAAARLGNIAMGSSPVSWLFGASSDFEWFDVPDSAAGRSGAAFGEVGSLFGGFAGVIRKGGGELLKRGPSAFARSLQGTRDYPGIDRFRDIVLKKSTYLVGGVPGQSNFYTTLSALNRSGFSASNLFSRLQVMVSRSRGTLRDRVAIYEVLEDTEAAFGLVRANTHYGPGGLPQIVIDGFESKLRVISELSLGP